MTDRPPRISIDQAALDQSFTAAYFPKGAVKANFIRNLDHSNHNKVYPRAPRLASDEACRVI